MDAEGTAGLGETKALPDGARVGQESARQGLLERLRPRLVLWASTRLSEKLRRNLEPDDVPQEILLAVHRDLESFRGRASSPSTPGSSASPRTGSGISPTTTKP